MTLQYTPTYPIAGETVTLSASGLSGTSDATQFYITAVPDRSLVTVGRIVGPDGEPTNTFIPDVDGEFSVTVYDYRRRSGITDDDARDLLLGTQTGKVNVAVVASLPIHTETGHGATLELRVIDDSIRQASLIEYLSEVSRVAAKGSAVVTALVALVGQLVSAIAADFDTDVNHIKDKMMAHFANETYHASADTENVITSYASFNRKSGIEVMGALADAIYHHMRGFTEDKGTWHREGDDTRNYPIAKRGLTLGEMQVVRADIRERVYERHRVMVNSDAGDEIHGSADVTNALSAPSRLDNVIVAYLDEIVDVTPATPAGEQDGAMLIERAVGFTIRRVTL